MWNLGLKAEKNQDFMKLSHIKTISNGFWKLLISAVKVYITKENTKIREPIPPKLQLSTAPSSRIGGIL